MKRLVRLGLCLVFALASCLTEDDVDPTTHEVSSRIAPVAESIPAPEPVAEPCAPTIAAISQTSFERGAEPYPNAYCACAYAPDIRGSNHDGATVELPDAGSDISFTTSVWGLGRVTTLLMTISQSTPLGFQRVILRNHCGGTADGGFWVDGVWAPRNLRATNYHAPNGRWNGVAVQWTNPSRTATHTRIDRRVVGETEWQSTRYNSTTISLFDYLDYSTTYEYRAVNLSEYESSPESNIAVVTTPPPPP